MIVFAPYSFANTESLWSIGKLMIENEEFPRLRLRIRANQSVSSLGVYESSYTYCPDKAIVISSRRNVKFSAEFWERLSSRISEKYHVYFTAFNSDAKTVTFSNLPVYSRLFREQCLHFKSHFRELQIFRSDLMKMVYLWILKSKEIDFYETEAAFMLPLLEMVRL